jgi:hypothetical protein
MNGQNDEQDKDTTKPPPPKVEPAPVASAPPPTVADNPVQSCSSGEPPASGPPGASRKDLIGPKARADLEKIPGGKELLAQHDNPDTPDEKALSLRQEAAVALHKDRNKADNPDDEVVAIGREVGEGKKKTEIDVETRTEQIELKGGDFSNRTSLNQDQNNRLTRKVKVAKDEGKKPVYQFEEGEINDRLKGKIEKRGVAVREGIPMEELNE